ncbi:MAG TPA: hypothetical protein VH247_05410 [Thermoleophilaceae bacterium]|jgi:hypothetical protein|nr:hypothetical protein [Thermoleophilaceae bacterium]
MNGLIRKLAPIGTMVAAVAIYAGVASGHDGGDNGRGGDRHGGDVLREALAPSMQGDPMFHNVAPGNVPWLLTRGEARLRLRGKLEIELRGLVIPNPPGDGTAGPVHTVTASLYCGADSVMTAVDTTDPVPLSPHGNARIRDRSFNVPTTCLAPVLLIHPNGDGTRYIAVSGWRR